MCTIASSLVGALNKHRSLNEIDSAINVLCAVFHPHAAHIFTQMQHIVCLLKLLSDSTEATHKQSFKARYSVQFGVSWMVWRVMIFLLLSYLNSHTSSVVLCCVRCIFSMWNVFACASWLWEGLLKCDYLFIIFQNSFSFNEISIAFILFERHSMWLL